MIREELEANADKQIEELTMNMTSQEVTELQTKMCYEAIERVGADKAEEYVKSLSNRKSCLMATMFEVVK